MRSLLWIESGLHVSKIHTKLRRKSRVDVGLNEGRLGTKIELMLLWLHLRVLELPSTRWNGHLHWLLR